MTKKQIAALIAAIISTGAAFAAGGNVKADSIVERVRAAEVRYEGIEKRLDRIESKLDDALKGGKR